MMTNDATPGNVPSSDLLGLVERLRQAAAKKWPDAHPAQPYSLFSQAADALEQWARLQDPAALHANLLRGLPAQLTREQFLHLAGDAPADTKGEQR